MATSQFKRQKILDLSLGLFRFFRQSVDSFR
jgi:hypothetical protein